MTLYVHLTDRDPDPGPDPGQSVVGFRWLHGAEGGRMPPAGMPEIVPPIEVRKLEMTEVIQWIAYRLELRLNKYWTTKLYTKAHTWDRAMNNGDKNGYNPRIALRDYPNGLNLKAATNPSYDKMQRGFGGSFFRGVVSGPDRVRCDPGVHGLDASKLKRSLSDFDNDFPAMIAYVEGIVDTLISEHWYVLGVSIDRQDFSIISHFPQGAIDTPDGIYYGVVAYPFLFDRPIEFLASNVTDWVSDHYPDPLYIYNPIPASMWKLPVRD